MDFTDGSVPSPATSGAAAPGRVAASPEALLAELERCRRRETMALELSRTGTWTRRMATGEVEWSPELCAIFGLSPAEAPHTVEEFMALVHPEDRAPFRETVQRAMAEHADYAYDFRYRHASGEYRWMSGRGRGFYEADGTLVESAGIGIEITPGKRAEEALQNRETQLRLIGDNLPDGALYQLVISPEGERRFIYWSAGIEALNGVSVAEAYRDPQSIYALIHPDDAARVAAIEARAVAERRPFDVVMRSQHRLTGEWRWVHLRSASRDLPDGGSIWEGIYLDITRSREVEEALSQSMERLGLAQRAGHIGVFDWNIRTDEVVWSEEQMEIFGVRPGEFEGKVQSWAAHVLPSDLLLLQELTRENIRRRAEEMVLAYRIVEPSGQIRWIEGAGRITYDAVGEAVRMVGVNVDVTERREAVRSLQMADQRKNEFLAMLGHELRNPLSAIRNALQAWTDTGHDKEARTWARGVIDRQSQQLTRLVDDLLDVSRITRGKIELRKTHVQLLTVLDRAVEAVRAMLRQRRHSLQRHYAAAEDLWLQADPARLEQVVVNLLVNAARYTEPGGRVELLAQRAGEEVIVTVRDSGIGIPPDRLPEMFELFTQGETSLARSEGGLGLGLTIVRNLVEMHGGRVEARSAGPGQGSEFSVRLPAQWEESGAVAAAARPGGKAAKITRRILVVDDNEDTAQGLARILRRAGAQVEISLDGREALEQVQKFRPAVVLLDIGLPEMDGYTVARALRALHGGEMMTIVAISGYGQEEDRVKSREAGMDHHLVKPVDLPALKAILSRG